MLHSLFYQDHKQLKFIGAYAFPSGVFHANDPSTLRQKGFVLFHQLKEFLGEMCLCVICCCLLLMLMPFFEVEHLCFHIDLG